MISLEPWALPITFGPHEADWWMVGITAGGVLTSAVVAISALVSSARARGIAEASENARVTANVERQTWEYRLRFEDALAVFMSDVGDYLVSARQAMDANASTKPPMDSLVAPLEIARLRARGADGDVMDLVRRVFSATFETVSITKARDTLIDLMRKLREYVSGDLDQPKMESWVEELEAELKRIAKPTGNGPSR